MLYLTSLFVFLVIEIAEHVTLLFALGIFFLGQPETITMLLLVTRLGLRSIDIKRLMISVVVALQPCVAFAHYHTGFQALRAIRFHQSTEEWWLRDGRRRLEERKR